MKRISILSILLLSAYSLAAYTPKIADSMVDIGIEREDRQISIDILNKVLASEFVLLAQTLNYHWNLVGPEFHDYHLLFNDQYKMIFEQIDAIAERVRAVGGVALGSLQQFIHNAAIQGNSAVPTPQEMVQHLLNQQQAIIRFLRDGIDQTAENQSDMGTSNFLTGLIEKHEKMSWMLRALLQ